MFYRIKENTIKKVGSSGFCSGDTGFGYMEFDEMIKEAGEFGLDANLLAEYKNRRRTGIDIYDEYSIAVLSIVNLPDVTADQDVILLIIKRSCLLVVRLKDDDDSTMAALEKAVTRYQQNASLEKIIAGTLDALIADGGEVHEKYGQHIMEMEGAVVNGKLCERLNREIFDLRSRLSELRYYYEQLVGLGEDMLENGNGVFQESGLRYIKIFTEKAARLGAIAKEQNENLIYLRESLDASLNYSMNRIMKVFTVVSVIFMPLTLIVGWYGMNFKYMPELGWKFGYAGVAVLCAAVLVVCLVYFNKMKWL